VDRLDDIDRALGLLRFARELLSAVPLCVPGLRAAIPATVTATGPLHDRFAEWTRTVEIAAGELDEWERALVQARAHALAEGMG